MGPFTSHSVPDPETIGDPTIRKTSKQLLATIAGSSLKVLADLVEANGGTTVDMYLSDTLEQITRRRHDAISALESKLPELPPAV